MAAPLSVTLGQHQLPGPKVCQELNKLTSDYVEGVPLVVRINTSPAPAGSNNVIYDIKIFPPTLNFFLSQAADSDRVVSSTALYGALLMWSEHNVSVAKANLVLATAKAGGYKIID